ncbi:allophanate hydrolase subunit 1 [Leisingera aquaemixtae]|uniref:5-oxoprolinase subunit B family protein n=1 Tax=Leisingera aquaemixtae TaxID=1396826 RepID=UPI001C97DE5F|nr:allophanate hydrolase subunit 1 [Leisingera aquaemixtae]MBY6069311.1 allophanate hydrolase subunit 1 [Leisingera aquaemixtae]
MESQDAAAYPLVRRAGLSGMLVSFGGSLSEASNRAALAFRTAVEALALEGVVETMASLASVFVRFEPSVLPHGRLEDALRELLATQDWLQAPLPAGRRFWRVPTVYGTDLAPQLAEAADAAGMSEAQAIDSLGAARVRVLTIGFAPGQPYLGSLGPEWNLPRQTELTPMVPRGALVQAISQFVLFSNPAPTGWRHVGQTGMTLFRAEAEQPFALRPGDEMQFEPVSKPDFLKLCEDDPLRGGAAAQEIQA